MNKGEVYLTNDQIHALLIVTDELDDPEDELLSDLASARLVLADEKAKRVREGVWYVS